MMQTMKRRTRVIPVEDDLWKSWIRELEPPAVGRFGWY
jgi:hypothetical protein